MWKAGKGFGNPLRRQLARQSHPMASSIDCFGEIGKTGCTDIENSVLKQALHLGDYDPIHVNDAGDSPGHC